MCMIVLKPHAICCFQNQARSTPVTATLLPVAANMDLCELDLHHCHANAACTPREFATYSCRCNNGYGERKGGESARIHDCIS